MSGGKKKVIYNQDMSYFIRIQVQNLDSSS